MTYNHVSLTFGQTGQVVEFYPPQGQLVAFGAPTVAASYSVYGGTQSNDETAKFSGTATLDPVATTFDAASGYSVTANRQRVNLASTSDIAVGGRYLLTNAQGQREYVTVTAISTDAYVDVEEPLCYDYASGDTFKGIRHYFTVDPTFVADPGNLNSAASSPLLEERGGGDIVKVPPFRVRWSYATGSVAYRTWTTFDLVRQPAVSNLSIHDLRGELPDVVFNDWIAQRGQDFMPQLEAAHRDARLAARVARYDPDSFRDPEVWDRIVLNKWKVQIGKALLFGGADVGAWLDMAIADDTKFFEKSIGTALNAFQDTNGTGGATINPPRQLWLGSR